MLVFSGVFPTENSPFMGDIRFKLPPGLTSVDDTRNHSWIPAMFGYSFHLVEAISLQFKRSTKKTCETPKMFGETFEEKYTLYRCFLSETYILCEFCEVSNENN